MLKNGNKKYLRCLEKSEADVRLGKCIRLITQFFNSENTNLILSLTTNSILGVFHSILHRRSAIYLLYNFTGDVFIIDQCDTVSVNLLCLDLSRQWSMPSC